MTDTREKQGEGIVAQAARHVGAPVWDAAGTDAAKLRSGVYEDGSAPIKPDADGYIRKSPVQPLLVDPAYKRRLFWRAVGTVAALLFAGAAIYALIFYVGFR